MKNTKFTLIELLVVVAIIGIISAMIIPSLGTARDKARERTCTNNLKQVGLAIKMYFAGGEETEMPVDDGNILTTDINGWAQLFQIQGENLDCIASRDVPADGTKYSIHTDADGANLNYNTIEGSETAIAGDTGLHRVDKKANILFGDGHVSTQHEDILDISNPVARP